MDEDSKKPTLSSSSETPSSSNSDTLPPVNTDASRFSGTDPFEHIIDMSDSEIVVQPPPSSIQTPPSASSYTYGSMRFSIHGTIENNIDMSSEGRVVRPRFRLRPRTPVARVSSQRSNKGTFRNCLDKSMIGLAIGAAVYIFQRLIEISWKPDYFPRKPFG
jgi:hypothetical protein